ncbi:MAG TPA: sugar transferase [Candidatus Aminicenantes bacterium]|nr:sugar transferase [Candidatus Aminicenantes bacterium]
MVSKRLFDIVFSLIGLTLLTPLLSTIAILIKKQDRGPMLYRGIRVGRYGKLFRIYKFRAMVVNAEKLGGSSTPADDPRITNVGKYIRKYKLDELPQLINVLMGQMSFVGPRPQVPEDVALYTKEEKSILSVRPGITDWASCKYHNEGEILRGSPDPDQAYIEKIRPGKIKLELEYVRNHSFWIDLKILLKTVKTLFSTRL